MSDNQVNNVAIQPNGEIIWPIEATVFWKDGQALGVWGKDFKVKPLLLTNEGTVRELNSLERILFANQIAGLHP